MNPESSQEQQEKLARQIIQNLPEPPKEAWFETPSPTLFFLIGFLFAMVCWILPQLIPFALLILLTLATGKTLFLKMTIFLAFLFLLVPIVEFKKWYCVECTAIKHSTTVYQITTFTQFKDTSYAKWYRRLVDHPEHSWKTYEISFRNLIYLELGKVGGEETLPFPVFDLYDPNPKLLEILKRMPPQEALPLFVNWKELYETEDFKTAFRLWKAETDSFLEWLKQKNPDYYQKLLFLLKSGKKPLPSLRFENPPK